MKEKVFIEIEDGKFSDGSPAVFVRYDTHTYGGSCPCGNVRGGGFANFKIGDAIESAKRTITEHGDIPIIKDLREKAKLTAWLK